MFCCCCFGVAWVCLVCGSSLRFGSVWLLSLSLLLLLVQQTNKQTNKQTTRVHPHHTMHTHLLVLFRFVFCSVPFLLLCFLLPPSPSRNTKQLSDIQSEIQSDLADAFGSKANAGLVGKTHWPKVDALRRETTMVLDAMKASNLKKLKKALAGAVTDFESAVKASTFSNNNKSQQRYVKQETLEETLNGLQQKVCVCATNCVCVFAWSCVAS